MKPRPTPPEDCNHPHLAMLAAEDAVNALAAAQYSQDRAAWMTAADLFDEARFQCSQAAAQLFRRWARVQMAQGLWPCSDCHQFFPVEELVEKVIDYGMGEKAKRSHWRTCQECLEKQR